jgi:hypothetical protein
MRKLGVTAEKALELVKEKRPSAHLNAVQKSFLMDFEKGLKVQ